MRKLTVKIIIVLFAVFITIIAAISLLILLINNGKLTSLIERQINRKTDFDVSIEAIHLDIFSGLKLKRISLQGLKNRQQCSLGCDSLTISYKPFELWKRRIKEITFSGVQINLDTEKKDTIPSPPSADVEIPVFNINDFYPESLFIEDLFINNIKIKIVTDGYVFTSTEMNVQVKGIQPAKPFDISIEGDVSISKRQNGTSSNLSGEIGINTKYSLSDDELIIRNNSYFIVKDLHRFSISGKICSILSTPEISCDISAHELPIDNIPDLLSDFMPEDFSSLILGGKCKLSLSIQGNFNKLRLESDTSINNLSLKTERAVFNANVLEISIKAAISPFDPKSIINADGKCVVHKGHLQTSNGKITALDLPIAFTLDYPNHTTLSSNVINGELHYGNNHCPVNKLISDINVNIDLKQPENIVYRLQVNTAFSDTLHIMGSIDTREKVIKDSTLNIHNVNCKTLSEIFKSLIPKNYKEWAFNGNISMDTTIDYADKSQKMTVITDLSLSDLKFASPDYDYFGEGINGHIKIKTNVDNSFNRFFVYADGTLDPFLIQLGEFTTDMKNRKTHFSLNSNYDTPNRLMSGIKGSLSWDNTGTITVTGDALRLTHDPHLDVNIAMEKLSNAAFFDTFIKDTVQYSNPVLFNSRIDGESSAFFHVKGSKDALFVDGHVNIKESNFEYGDIDIKDMNVYFPISIAYPRSKAIKRKQDIPDSQYGTIQLGKFSYGPLVIEDIQIAPIIISNNFFIKEPIKISVFDGTIDLRDISVADIINHDREIKLEVQINDINLKNMTTTYKLTPFEGSLSSSIMSFQQQERKLYSKDKIKIELFGGAVTITDLMLDNFLSPMRELGFSAEINQLDLGKMSNTYREWGDITGIINGRIKDFRLVAGEPSSFEIEMKTENYPDVKQTVSTKFLKNFVPGIGKVLDKVGLTNYKYAIMGLHARLENDYIKLQGAVREGGKELFMKGAGMKKLEIVFSNVDRRVSFKTFLNSFKGILGSDFEATQIEFK